MAKSIIKEIIIILLLALAIIIVLGLLLYDYVPMSKIVPEPVSYTTPENVKAELIESGEVDESKVILTYEVDSTDLNNYRNIKNYNPGKANPFSSYIQQEPENTTDTNSTTGTTTSNTNATTSNNSSSDTSTSGGKFFQDKGTK